MSLLPTPATVTEQPRLAILEELLLEDRLPAEDLLDEDAAQQPAPVSSRPESGAKRTRSRPPRG